jgi:hypothetical protein
MQKNRAAAQHGAGADRLDRGDFGIQKQETGFPIYQYHIFQPAAQRQAVRPLWNTCLPTSSLIKYEIESPATQE